MAILLVLRNASVETEGLGETSNHQLRNLVLSTQTPRPIVSLQRTSLL